MDIYCAPEAWIPDWIIEEKMERERRERDVHKQPYLEAPLPMPYGDEPLLVDKPKRGVIIIPL